MTHEEYMHRALLLAKNGFGSVSPNPMVGCVIVHNDVIIGEGWHQQFGESHAEVNAINSVNNKEFLKESTVYVTLEPCSYHGKTPACSNLLIRNQVKQVFIATLDPNPKVSGNGLMALEKASIETISSTLEIEAKELNKRFFINQKLKRPFVILKWAQTQDGFIARSNYDSKWISNEYSRQIVHQWRSDEDAVLVGKNTARHDNPSLTVRDWAGKNPIRILLDRNLELSQEHNLFNGEVCTLIYNCVKKDKQVGFELVKLDSSTFIDQVLADLYRRGISSLIVEGGSKVLESFIQLNLWDEARIFTSTQVFEEGIYAPKLTSTHESKQQIENDELTYYFNPKTKTHWQKN